MAGTWCCFLTLGFFPHLCPFPPLFFCEWKGCSFNAVTWTHFKHGGCWCPVSYSFMQPARFFCISRFTFSSSLTSLSTYSIQFTLSHLLLFSWLLIVADVWVFFLFFFFFATLVNKPELGKWSYKQGECSCPTELPITTRQKRVLMGCSVRHSYNWQKICLFSSQVS